MAFERAWRPSSGASRSQSYPSAVNTPKVRTP